MPNPKPTTLTPEIVAAHERLYPRLAALLKQIERVAGRRAGAEVPGETVALAKTLCDEARKLLGREGRGIVFGKTPDAAALALSQAVAALEAFEGENTILSAQHQAVCWLLPDGKRQPVARLRPTTPPKGANGWAQDEKKYREESRRIVLRRIIDRENQVYLLGYRDALDGKPPRKPLDEIEILN